MSGDEPQPHGRRGVWRRAVITLLLGVLLLALLLAVPSSSGALRTLGDASPAWVVVAVVLELLSCAGFIVIFRLCFAPIAAPRARRFAWVELASGALLPGGGVGGLAVGGGLIRLTGMPAREVVERSSALFFLTNGVNVVAILGAGSALVSGLSAGPDDPLRAGLPVLAAAAATVVVLALPALRHGDRDTRGRRAWIAGLIDGLRDAERALRQPDRRLLGAVGYLLFDLAVLWAAFAALGQRPPLAPLVLGYSIGNLAGLIPVPAGIGVLDAGLVGALAAYRIPTADATAAVLIYHAIGIWVPGLGGLLGLIGLRRERTADPDPAGSGAG